MVPVAVFDRLQQLLSTRRYPTEQREPLLRTDASDLQLIRQVLDAASAVSVAVEAEELAHANTQKARATYRDALRNWASRPVRLILEVPGAPIVTSTDMTPVNDVSFIIEVRTAVDPAGRDVQDIGPFTWSADPADAVSRFDDDPDRPGDTSFRLVHVQPADASGNQPDFTVTATDPNGVSGSLGCTPTPGGPSRLVLGVQ
jgi:hypothetical protein